MFADAKGFWVLLAFSLITGAMLGVFYDALRLFINTLLPEKKLNVSGRRLLGVDERSAERALYPIDVSVKARDVVYFFSDIVFCVISAFAVIILIFHLNYGEIRAFSLIAALAGFTVYKKTLGIAVYSLLSRVISFALKLIKKVAKVALYPIITPIKKITCHILGALRRRSVKKRAQKAVLAMEESERIRQEKRNRKNERDKGADTFR